MCGLNIAEMILKHLINRDEMQNIIYILIILYLTFNFSHGKTKGNPGSNRYLVGFESRIDPDSRKAIIDRYDGTIIKELHGYSFPVYLVEIKQVATDSIHSADILNKLEHESGIMYVSTHEKNENTDLYPSNPVRQGDFRISKPQNSKHASNIKPLTTNVYEEIISLHIPELHDIAVKSQTRKKSFKYNTVFEISIDKKGMVKYVRIVKSSIHNAGLRKKLRDCIYNWKDFPERTAPETLKVTFKLDM